MFALCSYPFVCILCMSITYSIYLLPLPSVSFFAILLDPPPLSAIKSTFESHTYLYLCACVGVFCI